MVSRKQYLLTLETRYLDSPNSYGSTQRTNLVTLGVFDTSVEAYTCGNALLEKMEALYPLNKHWNRKERLSKNGGPYNSPKHLISNLAYLETPFDFYLKVQELYLGCPMEALKEADSAKARYKHYKETENEEE